MVVGEDHRRRVVQQYLPQHLARVHAGAVDRAAEELLEGNEPMAVIEIEAAEYFVGAITQLGHEKGAGRVRCCERRSKSQRFAEMASCELQRRFEYRVAGRPNPGLCEAPLSVGVEQRAQR